MRGEALVVIDVQRGMFASGEQPHDGDAVLNRIADLVSRARAASVPVIFVQHDGGAGHPLEKPHDNWKVHQGTGYRDGDVVIEKRNCDAFQDTDLQTVLANRGITRVVMTGMMSEYCVDTTCRRAFSLGYAVVLASDAHTTFSKPYLDAGKIIQHHNEVLGGGFAETRAAATICFAPDEAIQ